MGDNMKLELLTPDSEYTDPEPYKRHDSFYLEDVYFVFDNTIFKFPKQYLLESPIFQNLFATGFTNNDSQEAAFTGNGTLIKPYGCNGVNKDIFALLLRLSRTNSYYTSGVIKQEWQDVLELASQWRMNRILDMAVRHLSDLKLDPITKLELAKKHAIQDKEWKFSAIHALVKDNSPLTVTLADRIGYDVALKVARVQGMVHAQSTGKDPFVGDDWKLFMDRLVKEGTLKEENRSPVDFLLSSPTSPTSRRHLILICSVLLFAICLVL
ncbi:hypothetical protein APHAL10511_004690 [Amanita phalloides]|nr:hypothetical protein APHAL10511_004690 [Amanita phalloides]